MKTKAMAFAGLALMLGGVLSGCANNANDAANQQTMNAEAVSTPWIATKNTTRINTSDPVLAAVLVSQSLWTAQSNNNRPSSVVLTSVDNWQIAAVSADLIHHPSNGPVLFFNKDGLSEATVHELKRLKPLGADSNDGVQAVTVGPVPDSVMVQLQELKLKVDTIAGNDPAEVAQAIDAYYAKVAGELPPGVIIGSMDRPEYILPAVNWIAHMPEPLLYVSKNNIPAATVEALRARKGKARIYIIGPEKAVSAGVEQKLAEYGQVTRISGDDPFANAVAFAQFKDAASGFGWGITTPGHNVSLLPENEPLLAVAAAPLSHLGKHAPLIFTQKDHLPDAVMNYSMALQPKFNESPAEGPYSHAWITGGTDTVSARAQSEIDDMLEISPASGGNPHAGH